MTKALQSVALGLLDEHMAHCVVDAAREGGPEADVKVKRSLRRHRPPRPVLTRRTENPMTETRTYTVTGMTCGHCVASVTEEVQEIAGVEAVDVVLETGRRHRHQRQRRRRRGRPGRRRGSRLPARMNSTPVRIAGFVVGLAAVFAVARRRGPAGRPDRPARAGRRTRRRRRTTATTAGTAATRAVRRPRRCRAGWPSPRTGYTLRLERTHRRAGRRVPVAFTIDGTRRRAGDGVRRRAREAAAPDRRTPRRHRLPARAPDPGRRRHLADPPRPDPGRLAGVRRLQRRPAAPAPSSAPTSRSRATTAPPSRRR